MTRTRPTRWELAHLPTPIHHLSRFSRELGCDIYVWRDDLTGFVESGNKIRKLEYALSEAREEGADHLVTCGGPQSNHARATVWLARRLGLGVTVVVREPKAGFDHAAVPTGNLLLNRIAGAEIRFVTYAAYQAAGASYHGFLEEERVRLQRAGRKPYLIPEGASFPPGCLGYWSGVQEARETWKRSGYPGTFADSVFCAIGSGGTHAGLYLGMQEFGLDPRRLFGVNVCDNREYFEQRVNRLLDETCERYGFQRSSVPLNILDGYVGEGYSIASDDDLAFYARLANLEGVLLDPCYTGKAFRGMCAEVTRDRSRFGKSVLFLHSGGTMATSAYAEQYSRVLRHVNEK
jgi:D-cysteine desulfhydrase